MASAQCAKNFAQKNNSAQNCFSHSDPFIEEKIATTYINPYLLIVIGIGISLFVTTYHFLGFKQHLEQEEKKLSKHIENLQFSDKFSELDEAMTVNARAAMQGHDREKLARYLENESAMKNLLDERFRKESNDPRSQKLILELRRTFRDLMRLEGGALGKDSTPYFLTNEYLEARQRIRDGLKKLNERVLVSEDVPLKSMKVLNDEFENRNKLVLASLILFWFVFGASLLWSKRVYEETRAKSERQKRILKTLVQGMPYGVLALDKEDNFILWNKKAKELTASDPESLGSNMWNEILLGIGPTERVINDNILRFNGVNLKDVDGCALGAVIMIEDITEQRKLEKDLQHELERKAHVSKMTTLGEVAGNLAHEINTPLSTVHISLDGMKRAISEDDKKSLASYMHCILQAVKRMGSIVSAFRRYSHMDAADEKAELVDIRDILSDALEICGPDIKARGIALERSIPSRPLIASCRPGPLSQAIINLMTNARDAAITVPKGWVKLSVSESDGWVLIDVEDAGRGLQEDVANRIFEPFFSTKPRGLGSGIGLGIVRDVARAHGGDVTHLKKNGHTCFEIKIPILVA